MSYYFLNITFLTVIKYWITFDNKDFDLKIGSGILDFTFGASLSTLVIMGLQYDLHGTNNPERISYLAAFHL